MTQQQVQKGSPEDISGPSYQNARPSSDGILRRNNRGCKSKDFYNWPEQPFEEMDSPLAVQQYIQQTIHKDPSDVDEILKLPEGQDLGAWKIEHLRLFCMQLNRLATKLQDCCHPETCNQMTATEQWIFLCAAHKQPNECPAIDYTRHTLDGAASLLNSNKYFPSRVTIKESSVAKLGSVCRRVYRIFSHAYYHHFQVFDEFERETHLCKRFSKFVINNDLMSKDSLIVPSDGSKPTVEQSNEAQVESTSSQDTSKVAPQNNATPAKDVNSSETTSQQESVKPSPDVKTTPQVETKIKKLTNETPMGTNQTQKQPWVSSTNTMVKGSNINSPKASNIDKSTTKSIDLESTESGSSTPGKTRKSATTKNGVESEA